MATVLRLVQPTKTFREVYDEQFAYVFRLLVFQFGMPERNAEDAAQELFVRFHKVFGEWDQTRSVKAFLWGFARNVASELRRKASTRYETLPGEDMPDRADPANAGERVAEKIAACQLVHAALDTLTEEHREILVAVEMEGLSVPEAAEQLGIPTNTGYSRVARAKEAFTAAVRRLSGSNV